MTRGRAVAIMALLPFVLTGGGVLATRGGGASPVLRTLVVGQNPAVVAANTRSGRVFVVTTNGNGGSVYVLDPARATLEHATALRDTPSSLMVDPRSGHVFVSYDGTSTASIAMFDGWSGRLIRVIPLAGTLSFPGSASTFAVDTQRGWVFVGAESSTFDSHGLQTAIVVLDAARGRVLRTITISTGQAWGSTIAVDGWAARIIVTGEGYSGRSGNRGSTGLVSVIDEKSGRLLHSIPVPAGARTPIMARASGGTGPLANQAFMLDGSFPPSSSSISAVHFLDLRRGILVHTTPLGSAPLDMAVDGRKRQLFVATIGPTARNAAAAGSNGPAFPVGMGSVSVLDARNGRILRTIPVGAIPYAVAMDARRGRVYVANAGPWDGARDAFTGPGSISVIDASSGAVLRTVDVGFAPVMLALDERANRLVVANYGGHVETRDRWGWAPGWVRRWLPFLPRPTTLIHTVPPRITVLDTARL